MGFRFLPLTGECHHSQVGEPNKTESKDQPQQDGEEAGPWSRIHAPE